MCVNILLDKSYYIEKKRIDFMNEKELIQHWHKLKSFLNKDLPRKLKEIDISTVSKGQVSLDKRVYKQDSTLNHAHF